MIRPSSLKSIEICSDFENDPNAEEHEITTAGTRIHKALEVGDPGDLNDEETELYMWAYEALQEELSKWFGNDAYQLANELVLRTNDGEYAGTIDVSAQNLEFKKAFICDYKTGFNPVDHPKDNIQFQDYTHKYFRTTKADVIRVVMIAPRIRRVEHHDFYRSDIPNIEARVALINARKGTGQRVAHPQCQFCKNLWACREAYTAFANAKHQGERLPVLRPNLDLTNPEDVRGALNVKDVFEAFYEGWMSEVKTAAKALLNEGFEIEGWEIKHKAGKYKLEDVDALWQEAERLGVYREEFDACFKGSFSQLIKKVRAIAPHRQKGKWEEDFRANTKNIVKQEPPTEYIGKIKS